MNPIYLVFILLITGIKIYKNNFGICILLFLIDNSHVTNQLIDNFFCDIIKRVIIISVLEKI
jgi:hypothetical protein